MDRQEITRKREVLRMKETAELNIAALTRKTESEVDTLVLPICINGVCPVSWKPRRS